MLYMSFVSFILPAEVSIEEKLNSSPLLCSTLNVVVSWVFILMLWIYMLMLWIIMQMLRIPYKNCEYIFYTHLNTGVYCIIFLYIYIYISTLQCDMTILVIIKQLHGVVMVDWLMSHICTLSDKGCLVVVLCVWC